MKDTRTINGIRRLAVSRLVSEGMPPMGAKALVRAAIYRAIRDAKAEALDMAADEICVRPEGWIDGHEQTLFDAGADAVYSALRARAAEIRSGNAHGTE